MGLICNGCMVSGTHILLKASELFGYRRLHGAIIPSGYQPKYFYGNNYIAGDRLDMTEKMSHKWIEQRLGDRAVHAHCPGYETKHKQLVILRDPRSMLAARTKKIWNQYDAVKGQPWKPHLRKQMTGDKPHDALIVLKEMNVVKEFHDMRKTDGFQVYFSDIFKQYKIDHIAEYLDKPPFDASKLYGGTPTFSPELTLWEDYWSEEAERILKDYGDEA